MNYYIVSEEELQACEALPFDKQEREKAKSEIRSRPVPDWATHFAENIEGPLDYGLYSLNLFALIKYEG